MNSPLPSRSLRTLTAIWLAVSAANAPLEGVFNPGGDIYVGAQMSTDGATWEYIGAQIYLVPASTARFRGVIIPGDFSTIYVGDPVTVVLPSGSGAVDVGLWGSTNLQDWSPVQAGDYALAGRAFVRVETSLMPDPPPGFVLLPPRDFSMGSPSFEMGREADELPHSVILTQSFFMQVNEVTWSEWQTVRTWASSRGYQFTGTGAGLSDDHPVVSVFWSDAVKWLNARSEMENLTPCYRVGGNIYKTGTQVPDCDFLADGYRLPTESEWEYACRGMSGQPFYNGPITYTLKTPLDPNLDLIGWYGGNCSSSQPVRQKQPNVYGLYDMSGNVWEWCWDWYGPYPGNVTDPTGPETGTHRVIRGGSWLYGAAHCRTANRDYRIPGSATNEVGFRAVRTVVR